MWAASAACLGRGARALDRARAAFREERDPDPLLGQAREAVGVETVERALAAHRGRLV